MATFDEDPEVASLPEIDEEREVEGFVYEEYGEEQEFVGAGRKKRRPPFRRRGLDYTLKEDKEVYRMGLEKDMLTCKAFLQREEKCPQKMIVYDHLAAVIDKIVTRKPENAGEVFDEYCRILRKAKYYPATDHLQDMYIPPQFTESEKILRLLKSVQQYPVSREYIEAEEMREVNLMESLRYFEQFGFGFPELETFLIRIKLQNLVKKNRIKTYRLWGKIYGMYNDYIIVETEQFPADIQRILEEEELEKRKKMEEEARLLAEEQEKIMIALEAAHVAQEAAIKEAEEKKHGEDELGEEEEGLFAEERPRSPPEFPPIPMPTFQKPPEVPPEKRGEGTNRKVYYVCTRLDDEWIQLPDVTPQQIQIARKIKKVFTGDLEAEIGTYPPFPGKEINYLRAQIARISATTMVSPKGYYKIEGGRGGEEEEEEEEELAEEEEEGGGKKGPVIENPAYRPKPMKDQVKLSNWVHHQEAILEQGRTTFWAPEKERVGEGEEEEAEEEELDEEGEAKGKGGKEKAIPLFRSISKDTSSHVKKLWTVHLNTSLIHESAFVMLRSVLWPGFYAFSAGSKYDALYMGMGLKYSPFNYSVPLVPVIQAEYVVGPEIMEIPDPTWAQEEAWRIAHEPKPMPQMMFGEGEGEEEEEEESDEPGGSPGDTDEDE